MAKKTTASRPYVAKLTTNLKSPDGKARSVELGPKTLIVGPNGSGKSAIQQSLQLALIGSADDLLGRDSVRDSALLMSLVSGDRLSIHAKLNTGEDFTFLAKDGGRPVHDSGTVASLPLHQVREVLEGGAAGARKAFLSWAAADVSNHDVADLVPAVYRAKYRDICDAMCRGKGAVDSLLTIVEYVGKRQRDAAKEVSGAEAMLVGMATDLETCPTEEMVAAAERHHRECQALLVNVQSAANQQAALAQRIANLQAKLAEPEVSPVDPTERDFYKGMAFAATVAVDRELTACPLCSSNVGKSHLVACRNFYNQTGRETPAGPSFNRALALSQLSDAFTQLEALPKDSPSATEVQRAATAAQEEYLRLRDLASRWANLGRARDTAAEMAMESETYKGMKKELEGVVASLLRRVAASFCERVQVFLPPTWKFRLQLEENGKDVFRYGFVVGDKLRAALSGAEWATMTCALAMAITTQLAPDQPAVVMPEDRGWDSATLGKVLNSWLRFEGQVVIATTTKPKKVPTGWVVIELKGAIEEEPEVVVPEVLPAVVAPPISPMTRQMLGAMGYPSAAVDGLTAEQAIEIISSGRTYTGGA